MTLVAGRMPSLHMLERNPYREDVNMQGILKSGPTRKCNNSVRMDLKPFTKKQTEYGQRNEDGKRLVRFCEAKENEELEERRSCETDVENEDVIMFGNNVYFINNHDPNSAVRKLFPNSKLKPINPFLNRLHAKDNSTSHSQINKLFDNNHNTFNRPRAKSNNGYVGNKDMNAEKIDRNRLRRSMLKVPPVTKPKTRKNIEPSTPLIERIKQLTCDSEDLKNEKDIEKGPLNFHHSLEKQSCTSYEPTKSCTTQRQTYQSQFQNTQNFPKQGKEEKEGLNFMRYNQHTISQVKPLESNRNDLINEDRNKSKPTDEARRSFLSMLSEKDEGEPGDRSSIATSSTTAETVYSLSDIEEALTEEEQEIKEAFSQESKQDELELFVQQDAGRTERLRKRYSSTPKPDNNISALFSTAPNSNLVHSPTNNQIIRKDKPKFGSTIEILQQLQQQIETPYQMEGRRTACSNYSDSSIPISERLFCDDFSDTYEPVHQKLSVQRTCSLDSKNYEEIDNYPSTFSVPRTKSHEHPHLNTFESDPYFYPQPPIRYSGNHMLRNQPLEQNVYASSPDLYGYQYSIAPDRVSSYGNHPNCSRQLHPVLQRQYCRYPVKPVPQWPAEEGKVLTPPSRMHTYINVPTNAPCYLSPPPYSKVNHHINPDVNADTYHHDHPYKPYNIYQNIPLPVNSQTLTARKLCTERERGAPEGASSSQDFKEMYMSPPKDCHFMSNVTTVPKPSSLSHHYCVDV